MVTFQFNPQQFQNYTFNPVLDGVNCVAVCTYNIYAQRYYISIYDTARTLIVINPIIASPDNYDVDLIYGYFNISTLIYRGSSNNFEVTP